MNNKLPRAVIISNDTGLQNRLESNQSANKKLLSVVLSSKLLTVSPRIDADAYLYDVELNNDDINSAIVDISNLKRNIYNKPLILIGDEYQLNQILSKKNVNRLVSKTIYKPLSVEQLLLTINSHSLSKKSRQRQIMFMCLGIFMSFYIAYIM